MYTVFAFLRPTALVHRPLIRWEERRDAADLLVAALAQLGVDVVSVDVPPAFAKGRHGLMLTFSASSDEAAVRDAKWTIAYAAAEARVTIGDGFEVIPEPQLHRQTLPLQGRKREDGQLKPKGWR